MRTRDGLRSIAVLEAAKGLLVLAVGMAAFKFIHADVQTAAEQLVREFHLDPGSRYPRIFLELVQKAGAIHLLPLAIGALFYAVIRLMEAYGLWFGRRWAEWLAVVSAGCYLPIELWELTQGITWPRMTLFALNLAIVAFLAWVLARQSADRRNDHPRRPA